MAWAWENNNNQKQDNFVDKSQKLFPQNDNNVQETRNDFKENVTTDNHFDSVLDDLFDEESVDKFDEMLDEIEDNEEIVQKTKESTIEKKQKRTTPPEDRVNYGYPQTREVTQEKNKKNNLIVHSIVDVELDDEDKIMQEKIDKLKLKSIVNDLSKQVMIGDYGMSVAEYLENKRKPRKKKGKQTEKIQRKKEKQIASLEKLKGKNVYSKSLLHANMLRLNNELKERKDYQKERKYNNDSLLEKSSTRKNRFYKAIGMSEKEAVKQLSVDSVLTDEEKLELLNSGYYGNVNIGKRIVGETRSLRLTPNDYIVLDFLAKYKVATPNILSIAVGKDASKVRRRLRRLLKMNLVELKLYGGFKEVWMTSQLGYSLVQDGIFLKVSASGLSQALVLAYVGACLYSNRINLLNLSDYPYHGREFMGQVVNGEDVLHEKAIRGSQTKAMYKGEKFKKLANGKKNYSEVQDEVERAWRIWESNGRKGESPEMGEGNEHYFILYPKEWNSQSAVIPDLVIRRPRSADGSSNHIAVEVELKRTKIKDLRAKLWGYYKDKQVYKKVVYVINSKYHYNLLMKVIEEIGMTKDDIDVVGLTDLNGNVMKNKMDVWNEF